VAAAIGEPGRGSGKIYVIGCFLKGDVALVQVGDEEGRRVEGGNGGTCRWRDGAWKHSAEQGARKGDTMVGCRAGRDSVQDGVGFVAERAEGRNLRIHTMSPFMCEQGVGETLHQETTVGGVEGFVHAMEGD
jgi:hypothetical protein